MARDFIINGECMVGVQGGEHLSGILCFPARELGLSVGPINIKPKWRLKDIRADDFGPEIPAETMFQLAEVEINMQLVHYDVNILDYCMSESMGGTLPAVAAIPPIALPRTLQPFAYAGTIAPYGSMMGNNCFRGESGCHYISLNLTSQQLGFPWRFLTSYLSCAPLNIPIGTEKSLVDLTWRAIPYSRQNVSGTNDQNGELISSGLVIWDHIED